MQTAAFSRHHPPLQLLLAISGQSGARQAGEWAQFTAQFPTRYRRPKHGGEPTLRFYGNAVSTIWRVGWGEVAQGVCHGGEGTRGWMLCTPHVLLGQLLSGKMPGTIRVALPPALTGTPPPRPFSSTWGAGRLVEPQTPWGCHRHPIHWSCRQYLYVEY